MSFKRFLRLTAACTACILTAGLFAGCAVSWANEVPPYQNARDVTALGADKGGSADMCDFFASLDEAEKSELVLWFPAGTYTFKKSMVIPRRFGIVLADGVRLVIEEEASVGFASPVFAAPAKQVFFGEGRVRSFGNGVNVRAEWFGAVPNDGKDDSVGIQKAIYASAGRLWLEKGVYDFAAPVTLNSSDVGVGGSDACIRGVAGGGTVIKVAPDVTAFVSDSGKSAAGYYFDSLAFEGKGSGAAMELYERIYISNCSFKNLDRGLYNKCGGMCSYLFCTAENVKNSVFDIGEDTMFIYFSGNRAKKCGTLIKVRGAGAKTTGIQITDCHTEDMTGYDIDLIAAGGDTNFIDGCTFKGGTGKAFVSLRSILYPHVVDCVFEGAPEKTGVEIEGCNHDVSVMRSVFKGLLTGVSVMSCTSFSATGNWFKDNNCDLRVMSNIGTSVHDNFFGSDNAIETYGINSCLTINDNRFAKAEFNITENFSNDETVELADNVFSAKEDRPDPITDNYKNYYIAPAVTPAVHSSIVLAKSGTASVREYLKDGVTVAEAIDAAVKSGAKTVIFDGGDFDIDADVTIPENVAVAVATDTILHVADGKTLTILSENVDYLPAKQLFTGAVVMNNAPYALSEWFGGAGNDEDDDTAAVSAAVNTGAGIVRLLRGDYNFESTVNVGAGAAGGVMGEGHDITRVIGIFSDGAVFNVTDLAKGKRFGISAFKFVGNKTAGLVSYTGDGNFENDGVVSVVDIFGGSSKNFIYVENAANVEIADLYLGTVDGVVVSRGAQNIRGLRSLSMPGAGFFMDLDGATASGGKAGGYYFHNFCSVYCLKNLRVYNTDGFYFSAAGFDSAYGDREITLDFRYSENVRFETTFFTTTHQKQLSIMNCKNVEFIGNPFNSGEASAIDVRDSEDIRILDNWFYHFKDTLITANNVKDLQLVGNHFHQQLQRVDILTADNVTGVMAGNHSYSTQPFTEVAGMTYKANMTNMDKTPEITKKIKLALKEFEELLYASHGNTCTSGVTYKDGKDYVMSVATGNWFGNVGITTVAKKALSGLTTEFVMERDTYADVNDARNFSIVFTAAKPSAMKAKGNGQTDVNDSIILSFTFEQGGIGFAARGTGSYRSAAKVGKQIVVTSEGVPESSGRIKLEFAAEGDNLTVSINGGEKITLEGVVKALGSEAYLTYFIQGYGAAGIIARIVTLNGSPLK
ncbi:MAG: hypothetical protein II808_02600 [Clostridia bacterium]|nr:hypothetical protein [Clostridia bacterium]